MIVIFLTILFCGSVTRCQNVELSTDPLFHSTKPIPESHGFGQSSTEETEFSKETTTTNSIHLSGPKNVVSADSDEYLDDSSTELIINGDATTTVTNQTPSPKDQEARVDPIKLLSNNSKTLENNQIATNQTNSSSKIDERPETTQISFDKVNGTSEHFITKQPESGQSINEEITAHISTTADDLNKTAEDVFNDYELIFTKPTTETTGILKIWLAEQKSRSDNDDNDDVILINGSNHTTTLPNTFDNANHSVNLNANNTRTNVNGVNSSTNNVETESNVLSKLPAVAEKKTESTVSSADAVRENVNKAYEDKLSRITTDGITLLQPIFVKNTTTFLRLNEPFFYGSILNENGELCFAMNVSMQIFVDDEPLELPVYYGAKGSYSQNNGSLIFYAGNEDGNYNVTSHFVIYCNGSSCIVDGVKIAIEEYPNGTSINGSKTNIGMFNTKVGTISEHTEEITLNMVNGISVYFSYMKIFVGEHWGSIKSSAESNFFAHYYIEILGVGVPLVIIIGIIIYLWVKVHKRNSNSFNTMI